MNDMYNLIHPANNIHEKTTRFWLTDFQIALEIIW